MNERGVIGRQQDPTASEPGNPRNVYLYGALGSTIAMFAAGFVAEINFWAYASLFGWLNGLFVGIAY